MGGIPIELLGAVDARSWGSDGRVLRRLVARGSTDHHEDDDWRTYLLDFPAGALVVPGPPTEPVRDPTGSVERSILGIDAVLHIDGVEVAPRVAHPLDAGATVAGNGRAVVLEQLALRPRASMRYVTLRQEMAVRDTSVLVLAGRVAVARRWRALDILRSEALTMGCSGKLRPGAVQPELVLVSDLV